MHRSGKIHLEADALSRYPVEAVEELNDDPNILVAAFSIAECKVEFREAQEMVTE